MPKLEYKEPTNIQPDNKDQEFEYFFKIDQETEFDQIKKLLLCLTKHNTFCRPDELHRRQSIPDYFKYTDQQIENKAWTPEDLQTATDYLKQEKINSYFRQVVDKFYHEVSGTPVNQSIIRKETEKAITNTPNLCLIIGHRRIGKTSMAYTIKKTTQNTKPGGD